MDNEMPYGKDLNELLEELDSLVGLESVKRAIIHMANVCELVNVTN